MINYSYTKVCCYIGYLVQAIINNFLPLLFVIFNESYGITYDKIGTLILINFMIQIGVDLCSIKFVKWLGYKRTVILANGLAGIGLILLSVLPKIIPNTYLAVVLSVLCYAFGSGLIEVVISPIIEYLPSKNKAGGMSLLHSFYCWGQLGTVLLTTAMFATLGSENWSLFPLIWAAVPIINLFLFLKAPVIEPESVSKDGKEKRLLKSRLFYVMLALMVCAGASEITVSQWSSTFAEQGLNLTKAVGDLTGPCMFALLMGTGRLIYGIVGDRLPLKKALLFCAALCTVCYIIIGVSDNPVLSLVFCAVCGFSVSIMWPAIISMSAAAFKYGTALMFSLIAAFGDIGCSVGPFTAGIVADNSTLKTGILAATVFPLLMVTILLLKDFIAKCDKKY